jgi:hypothetical protein
MKEKPEHGTDYNMNETMTARIEIADLGDPARQSKILDALTTLNGVIASKIQKDALHVSYDPLETTEKEIEQAIRRTGSTVTTGSTERSTPHPEMPANPS